jgi:hypothetical protein
MIGARLTTLLFSFLVILSACETETTRKNSTESKKSSLSEVFTPINTFTTQPTEETTLFSVSDIYSYDNRLYISDISGDKIVVFDTTGHLLYKWGKTGKGPGEFQSPNAISIGPDGQVYVGDSDNNRVQIFTPSGTYLRQFDTNVTQIFDILVTDINNKKRVYIIGRRSCGSEQCAIHTYDKKGEIIRSFGSLMDQNTYIYTWVSGWGPNKTILLSHIHTPKIRIFSLRGEHLKTVDISTPNWIGLYDGEQSLSVRSAFDLLNSKKHTRIRSISHTNDKYVVQLFPSNFDNERENLLSLYSLDGTLTHHSMKTENVMVKDEPLTLYEYLPEGNGAITIERYAYEGQ